VLAAYGPFAIADRFTCGKPAPLGLIAKPVTCGSLASRLMALRFTPRWRLALARPHARPSCALLQPIRVLCTLRPESDGGSVALVRFAPLVFGFDAPAEAAIGAAGGVGVAVGCRESLPKRGYRLY